MNFRVLTLSITKILYEIPIEAESAAEAQKMAIEKLHTAFPLTAERCSTNHVIITVAEPNLPIQQEIGIKLWPN